MKITIRILSVTLMLILAKADLSAQQVDTKPKKIETAEIAVKGVCGMCKKRIEKAALVKGVKLATWDKYKQTLKIIYQPAKVNPDQVCSAVVAVGHDAGALVAADSVYTKLPGCCQYRGDVEVH